MQEWFKDWFNSPYYYLLYQNRNDDEAKHFVDSICRHLQLKEDQTLLDVACGKGRHSKAFAAYGLDVTGVDLSENSIREAEKFATSTLHFYVHDMRRPFRINYFDVVCNLFTSFGYFKTSHDHQLAAKAMYASVKPGGIFVIDFANRAFAISSIEKNKYEEIKSGDVEFIVERNYTNTRLIKTIQIKDGTKEFQFEESLHSFSWKDLKTLFEQCGFQYQYTFGNYALEAFDINLSPRMILIFKK